MDLRSLLALDLNNDSPVDLVDGAMLAELVTNPSAGKAPTGASGAQQAQSMSLCPPLCEEECPPNCPPPACPSALSNVRVARVKYDYRNQMVEYEARDNACVEDIDEVTLYAYDALGRRVMKTLGWGRPRSWSSTDTALASLAPPDYNADSLPRPTPTREGVLNGSVRGALVASPMP